MPELPEVETTLRGIESHIINKTITSVVVRNPSLRWPVPVKKIKKELENKKIDRIYRRGKYLLLESRGQYLIIHLGMSGSLRIAKNNENFFIKHDHVELIFDDERIIYNDPRRFGSMHITSNYEKHKLIKNLGPEPLSKNFNAESFYTACKTSKTNIKSFLMNQKNVVGIGNTYASESLFLSSISPLRDAKDLDLNECKKLVASGKKILKKAINVGGTTLKDFYSADGSPGYFKFELNVYGRENESCNNCCENISKIVINQRATFFCKSCQN